MGKTEEGAGRYFGTPQRSAQPWLPHTPGLRKSRIAALAQAMRVLIFFLSRRLATGDLLCGLILYHITFITTPFVIMPNRFYSTLLMIRPCRYCLFCPEHEIGMRVGKVKTMGQRTILNDIL